ncbi:hypothetical protein PIB30_046301 [Stylosanthes scabra]|uniref:Uncharacterized protein n=1 Tax=Stylosanthes scabra TaxID=79078 RepID=A0ABU6RGF8_9FABA|nr:hypothetical protein [Stylosanthes scabra]
MGTPREGETEFNVCNEERERRIEKGRFLSNFATVLELHVAGVHGGNPIAASPELTRNVFGRRKLPLTSEIVAATVGALEVVGVA